MTHPPRRGLFITFEGIDGCGKSTQAGRLARSLREHGREVVLTREPGGSAGAEEIRRLVLEGAPERWSAETELLLFTAARRDHVERTIGPALDAGKVVICDRFADSTRVYQGATRGDLRRLVDRLTEMMIEIEPQVTILIDIDPRTGLDRALGRKGGEERFERFGQAWQDRIRQGFLALAEQYPQRILRIDGQRSEEAVAADILKAVEDQGLGA